MPETYDEYKRRTGKEQKKQNTVDPKTVRLVMQAAVNAELLMGDQNWDPYLQAMQYAVECINDQIDACKEQLHNPRIVDQNTLMQYKIALSGLESQKFALEWAVALPRDIKDNGKRAKDLYEDAIDN